MSFILKRQSIRKYKNDKINNDQIEILLRSAMQAPSAHNQQPWEFLVVNDKSIIRELAEISISFRPLLTAPLVIIPLLKPKKKSPDFIIQDLSAATQNILLEATNIGLGSVWMGVYPKKERVAAVTKVLKIKPPLAPFSIIAIGFKDEQKEIKSRYDVSRVHYNKME